MMNSKRAIVVAIILAWLPTLGAPAFGALWQWSLTPSSNASADPSINFREGQSPSSVNDSARALMAAVAAYRDDISGRLVATGTSTAFLVTTNQGLCVSPSTVPQDGQLLAIIPPATNGAGVTLQADSCGAYPIQTAVGVAVPAGTLLNAAPYTLRFSTFASAWLLRDFYGDALTVPLGGMIPYTGTTVPNSNFVFPAGQCLSSTTYAAYFALLGSPASGSCPGGQFQIIDLSGRVPAGLDTMPGFSAAGRLTSSSTGCGTAMTSVGARCVNGSESHTLSIAEMPSHTHTPTLTDPGHAHNIVQGNAAVSSPGTAVLASSNNFGSNAASVSTTTGISLTIASVGGGGAHSIVMPVVGVTYLLRVL